MVLRLCLTALVFVGCSFAANAQSIHELLPTASPDKGANVFKKCRACHTVEEGGPNRVGPNLWGIIGRPVASVADYSYSNAMVEFGGVWEIDRLDAYLAKPRGVVPGGKMAFAGLPKPQERADLIAYLNQNSPDPATFDAAGEGGDDGEDGDEAATGPVEEDFGLLVVAPGVEETYAYCTPCHSEMIVAQQGKTRDGWAKLFTWMVDEQGMAAIDEPDRSTILDYLEAHYNTDRPNFPR